MNNLDEMGTRARDTLTVRRVYGDPYEKNGITVIPAASLRGGIAGGEGEQGDAEATGSGAGFAMTARPVGAYRIKGDEVSWIPAADTTRVIILAEFVAIVALMVFRSVARSRRRIKN